MTRASTSSACGSTRRSTRALPAPRSTWRGRGPAGVHAFAYRVVEAEGRAALTLDVDASLARSEDVVVIARPTLVGIERPLTVAVEPIPDQRPGGAPIRVGSYVVVEVVLAAPVARDLVVLDDPPLPAGFEAVNDGFASGDDRRPLVDDPSSGAVTHREQREDRVVTFFDALEPGVHVTRYVLRAIAPGSFVTAPARAECMYAPEIFGRTATTEIAVGR